MKCDNWYPGLYRNMQDNENNPTETSQETLAWQSFFLKHYPPANSFADMENVYTLNQCVSLLRGMDQDPESILLKDVRNFLEANYQSDRIGGDVVYLVC